MNSLLLTCCLFAAAPAIEHETLPRASTAVEWALADVQTQHPETQPHIRYVWIPPWGTPAWTQAVSFAVNTAASQSARIHYPSAAANGWLLRWDLRLLAPDHDRYAKLASVWDKLAINEPYFHVSIVGFGIKGEFPPVAPHVDGNAFLQLAQVTNSRCPIVRADYLIVRMLSTLDGGLYYEFLQVERKPAKGTAQDAFLASIGADLAQSRELLAQQRAAIFRSQVTGKPRRVDFLYSGGVRPSIGTGLVMITHDQTDESVKANENPILNLLAFVDAAREVIAERPNGLHAFLLFDNRGNLQDSVPDNIARDHTIPAPHTGRLQGAISCIRCHGPDEGLKTANNDVTAILDSGFDVFDDVKANSVSEALDSLAAFYLGRLDKPLRRGRDDYSEAVFLATQGLSVPDAAATVSEIYGSWLYESVSADRAVMEIGYRVKPGQGVAFLKEIVPALPPSDGVRSREHAFIAFLKSGASINRKDFDAVYSDFADRAEKTALVWSKENAKP